MTRNMLAALALLITVVGPALRAAVPEPPPEGMTYYFMVLNEAEPGTAKTAVADVAALGGKVVESNGSTYVILLPKAAARELRAKETVFHLQRIWMGESFAAWQESEPAVPGRKVKANGPETDLTWETGDFGYDGSGNIKTIGPDGYAYDSAGRLIQAAVGGRTESYRYDSFGNLGERALAGGATTTIPVDPSSNRVVGYTYDVAGNIVAPRGRNIYFYDQVGMMTLVEGATGTYRRMIYTADDERIGVLRGEQDEHWKIRGFDGRVLREFVGTGQTYGWWRWYRDYVYVDGRLVAGLVEPDPLLGDRRHFHVDHLGSVRMITTQDRLKIARTDYYPFGTEQTSIMQERTNFGEAYRPEPMKFTGHERDYLGRLNVENTDYLDYMHARYYDPNLGRFLSVDPGRDWHPAQPQSWNSYAYARNSPVVRVDPDGRASPAPPSANETAQHLQFLEDQKRQKPPEPTQFEKAKPLMQAKMQNTPYAIWQRERKHVREDAMSGIKSFGLSIGLKGLFAGLKLSNPYSVDHSKVELDGGAKTGNVGLSADRALGDESSNPSDEGTNTAFNLFVPVGPFLKFSMEIDVVEMILDAPSHKRLLEMTLDGPPPLKDDDR